MKDFFSRSYWPQGVFSAGLILLSLMLIFNALLTKDFDIATIRTWGVMFTVAAIHGSGLLLGATCIFKEEGQPSFHRKIFVYLAVIHLAALLTYAVTFSMV